MKLSLLSFCCLLIVSCKEYQKLSFTKTISSTKFDNTSLINVDENQRGYINKSNGNIIFSPDTSRIQFTDFFNERYLLIKQVSAKYINTVSTAFVPISNAIIIDLKQPENIYKMEGESNLLTVDINSISIYSNKIVFNSVQNKQIIFRRIAPF